MSFFSLAIIIFSKSWYLKANANFGNVCEVKNYEQQSLGKLDSKRHRKIPLVT